MGKTGYEGPRGIRCHFMKKQQFVFVLLCLAINFAANGFATDASSDDSSTVGSVAGENLARGKLRQRRRRIKALAGTQGDAPSLDSQFQPIPPTVQTDRLGGVDVPTAEVLKKMHAGQYILHGHDGKLTKVPAVKVLLPHDPDAHPQAIQVVQGAEDTVYANLASIICKSTDGGRNWMSHKKGPGGTGIFEVLDDGSFVLIGSEGEGSETRVVFRKSRDEGRTWQALSEIANPPGYNGGSSWITRRTDGSLLAGISHGNSVFEEVDGKLTWKSGGGGTWSYLSKDKGQTWTRLSVIHDWAGEGGVDQTPSGKFVAALRYQRPTLPGDAPDLEKRNRSISSGWPWKNVFLADSDDQGHTWKNFRQLTTVFGQTRGVPVALSDGTVLVIHDTRYGPGSPGSRAMISRDEGRIWQDEVYYLDFTTFTGSYNGSVVLDDDLILSVVGSSQAGNSWEKVKGHTDFYAIRWKP